MRIVGIAGSLRVGSFNRALVRACAEAAPGGLVVEAFDLRGVPLYDADLEAAGDPPRVVELKEALRAADGLLVATPEYNHGVPGVLKNAIDWTSRPPRDSVLDGLSVGVVGASPGGGGTRRAQSQLRQAFVFTNSFCMNRPEVLVSSAHEKFDADGGLADEPTRAHLAKFMGALAEWILRMGKGGGG